jgi:hypothetical protein
VVKSARKINKLKMVIRFQKGYVLVTIIVVHWKENKIVIFNVVNYLSGWKVLEENDGLIAMVDKRKIGIGLAFPAMIKNFSNLKVGPE